MAGPSFDPRQIVRGQLVGVEVALHERDGYGGPARRIGSILQGTSPDWISLRRAPRGGRRASRGRPRPAPARRRPLVQRVVGALHQQVRPQRVSSSSGVSSSKMTTKSTDGEARQHGGAGGFGLHRAGRALKAADAVVGIQARRPAGRIAPRACSSRWTCPGCSRSKQPLVKPMRQPLRRQRSTCSAAASRVTILRSAPPCGDQPAKQVVLARHRGADFADHDAGRDVGQPHRDLQLQPGRHAGRERGDHGVARARHVEHLGRLGRESAARRPRRPGSCRPRPRVTSTAPKPCRSRRSVAAATIAASLSTGMPVAAAARAGSA